MQSNRGKDFELQMREKAGPKTPRLIHKNGRPNLQHLGIKRDRKAFFSDIFHTIVDAQWRWTLLSFCLTYIISWAIFAVFWWILAYYHGDLEPEHWHDKDWIPCVWNLTGFTSCFLYSVEVQHTTGFGVRMTSEKCPDAVFLTCAQSIMGVLLEAFLVGMIFTKMARPKNRAETLLFSKNAVIGMRDGALTLQVRVGDKRKSRIVEAHVRAMVITKKVTAEGELLPFDQKEISIGVDGEDRILLLWPTTLSHTITEDSPLYNMSAADLANGALELVVVLEGIVEATGLSVQARASYLPEEILWGHRLPSVMDYDRKSGSYAMDFSKFHETLPVDTPICSMRDLHGETSLDTAEF